MALLYSEKIPLGEKAKPFSLNSVDGKVYDLQSFSDKQVLVILFICNHCPYVQAIEDRIIALQRHFAEQSVQLVGICSNDPTDYPEDAPGRLLARWKEKQYRFPYLVDVTQDVARSYGAVCTPDIFVFDRTRSLAYHGRLDDNWKEPRLVRKEELKEAIGMILDYKAPKSEQHPAMGCSIKWKKGS